MVTAHGTIYFPLFSRHVMGEYYARNFVLGPLLVTTRDARTDLAQWDLLFPFFHYRQDLNSSNSWLLPALLVRRRPIEGRSLSLYPAALRLL